MLQRFIIFLIRRRFKLKNGEMFQFVNQRSDKIYYYFTDRCLFRWDDEHQHLELSRCSLNWLLDDRCEIIKKEV